MKKLFKTLIGKKRNRCFEPMLEAKYLFDQGHIEMPSRKTKQAAGYDICSAINKTILPGEKQVIPTGLTAYMKDDEFLGIYIRSGLAYSKDLTLQNCVGVIDADYYGKEIKVMVRNESQEPFEIKVGHRIAQGIFHKYLTVDDDGTSKKEERKGGFGSTGTN